MEAPGKIYYHSGYVFVNERGKGFHVIDNRDPNSPQTVAFFQIPGNYDMAAKGNLLYADSYLDLLVLDISNPAAIQQLKRVENALPYQQFFNGYQADPALGVVQEWVPKEVTEVVSCSSFGRGNGGFRNDAAVLENTFQGNGVGPTPSNSAPTTGVGGSMARLTLVNNHLYYVTRDGLVPISIQNPIEPESRNLISFGWEIETIYPFKDHLFVGSRTGMFIFDLVDPAEPNMLGTFQHANACDPVVVEGNTAYVTLRDGNECDNFINQLEVVDVSNLTNPRLLKTYPMYNPHGLGIKDGILFICDGDDGLKIYDAADPYAIDQNQLAHYKNISTYDVIPLADLLLMIGNDGLYQYDYSDLNNIRLLSVIPTQ
ncbi:MAG: hypothetical protein AAGI38_22895 [Bacteroidota bacterium]